MNNKIKIPVERLKQIIQEEVNNFYGLEEETLVGDEEEYDEDELDEEVTLTGADSATKQDVVNAINQMPPNKAAEAGLKAGIPIRGMRVS